MSEFIQKVSETITGLESPDEGRPGVDSPDGPRPEAFLGNGRALMTTPPLLRVIQPLLRRIQMKPQGAPRTHAPATTARPAAG